MNWEKLFLRYIWNEQTTPYLTPVEKLNRRQGNSEILIYSLFLGVFFATVSLVALIGGPEGKSLGISVYGFSVVCAAALFYILKSYSAALYLSATPLAALAYVIFYGLGAERAVFDTLLVVVILLLLLRYSFRIVSIARIYPELPEPTEPPEPPHPFRG